ncbi:MAG: 4Fe-4S dicluster domain-containing protein [Thermodesulfobacteriota bacterium]
MTQYGFFFDQSRCIGCSGCTVACKQWHDIAPGPVKWMRVYQWEKGLFPDTRVYMLAIPCLHCENPVCARACPNNAIYKEDKYGAVLLDREKCDGSRKCLQACPYGAPQFAGDDPGLKMSKCDMCLDRLEAGLKPICVLSCSMRALEFDTLEKLVEKFGNVRRLEDMPPEKITRPSVVFKAADPKKQIVPMDYLKALKLWQKRENPDNGVLPDVFRSADDVLQASPQIIGRHKLELKPKNSAALMYYTTDDE